MKIAVLGAGAMGCFYGAQLSKAGQDVTLLDINVPHIEAIQARGLLVRHRDGEERITVRACRPAEYPGIADVVIVFTKGIHSAGALASLAGAVGPETLLVSFQNGLGHERVMGAYADPERIVIGTTSFPSDLVENGVIATGGDGVTRMMTVCGLVTPGLERLHTVFKEAGLNPELTANVFAAIWEKAAFNAALNALMAVTSLQQGYLGQTKEGMELAHTVVDEVTGVAQKKSVPVNSARVHEMVDKLMVAHFDHCPSMLQDVLHGRVTEVDCINGAVVREAEAMGILVPVTKVLYQLICVIQQTYPHRLTAVQKKDL